MTTTSENALLPCPFCGETLTTHAWPHSGETWAEHPDNGDGCMLSLLTFNITEAERWNRRIAQEPPHE